MSAPDQPTATRLDAGVFLAVAVVLTAMNLRPAITSVGPVLDQVQSALGTSESWAGLLTTIPVLCFAFGGLLAPALARWAGTRAVIWFGLGLVAVGLVLRALGGPFVVLGATLLAAAGISFIAVLMPVVVKGAYPSRVGTMTGVYTAALQFGAVLGFALTPPLAGAFVSWRPALALWAVLALVALAAWLPASRNALVLHAQLARAASSASSAKRPGSATSTTAADSSASTSSTPAATRTPSATAEAEPQGTGDPSVSQPEHPDSPEATTDPVAPYAGPPTAKVASPTVPALQPEQPAPTADSPKPVPGQSNSGANSSAATASRTDSLLRSPLAWTITVFFGLQAMVAFVIIGWLPQVLMDAGVSRGGSGFLLALLSILALPISLLIPPMAARQGSQSGWIIALGACGLAGLIGLITAPGAAPLLWSILLGLGMSVFSLALVVIALRAGTSEETAKLSGMAQGVGYLIAATGPLLFGVLHESTEGWTTPLTLLTAVLVIQIITGALAGRPRTV